MENTSKLQRALRIVSAIILLQTLYFKFSGAEESRWIFEQLGAEPWGRIGSGVAELICAVLLLLPSTAWLGALGSLGVISGALLSHIFILGIEVKGDGGQLFGLAVVVFACSLCLLWMQREKVKQVLRGGSVSG